MTSSQLSSSGPYNPIKVSTAPLKKGSKHSTTNKGSWAGRDVSLLNRSCWTSKACEFKSINITIPSKSSIVRWSSRRYILGPRRQSQQSKTKAIVWGYKISGANSKMSTITSSSWSSPGSKKKSNSNFTTTQKPWLRCWSPTWLLTKACGK